MEIFFTSPGVLLEKFVSQLDRVSGPLATAIKNVFHYLLTQKQKLPVKDWLNSDPYGRLYM